MTFQFEFAELKLNTSQIENTIGYKEGENRGLVTDLIKDILIESEEICTIKAEYAIYDNVKLNNIDKSIDIDNLNFQINKIVFGQIKKSESVAIFLCTAGKDISARSRKTMNERDLLKVYIYDVVGSEVVEAAADLMQENLGLMVSDEGMKITNRFSPGYCGWNVAEQHKLFRLMPENYCGITLTDSALMNPVKSVSGIIGIGKNVKKNPYTCNLCDNENCIYRKNT